MATEFTATRDGGKLKPRVLQSEFVTVAVLSLSWALVLKDVTLGNFLMPFIAPSLRLDNSHIGILESAYWLPFALSSYLTGELADRFGRRKTLFLIVMLLFSLFSVMPGSKILRAARVECLCNQAARNSDLKWESWRWPAQWGARGVGMNSRCGTRIPGARCLAS